MNTEIIYNKEKIAETLSLLKDYREKISKLSEETDETINKIVNAKGFEFLENEETSIDTKMPKKLVLECEEEMTNVITTIADKRTIIEDFLSSKEKSSDLLEESLETLDNKIALVGNPVSIGKLKTALDTSTQELILEEEDVFDPEEDIIIDSTIVDTSEEQKDLYQEAIVETKETLLTENTKITEDGFQDAIETSSTALESEEVFDPEESDEKITTETKTITENPELQQGTYEEALVKEDPALLNHDNKLEGDQQTNSLETDMYKEAIAEAKQQLLSKEDLSKIDTSVANQSESIKTNTTNIIENEEINNSIQPLSQQSPIPITTNNETVKASQESFPEYEKIPNTSIPNDTGMEQTSIRNANIINTIGKNIAGIATVATAAKLVNVLDKKAKEELEEINEEDKIKYQKGSSF